MESWDRTWKEVCVKGCSVDPVWCGGEGGKVRNQGTVRAVNATPDAKDNNKMNTAIRKTEGVCLYVCVNV